MPRPSAKSLAALVGTFALAWLGMRYLLPLLLPFLLGGLLALAAEPAVGFLEKRLRLSRGASTGLGVTATLLLLCCVLVLLATLAVRQLRSLGAILPDLAQSAGSGLAALEDFLYDLACRAPDGLRATLTGAVSSLFSGSSAILSQFTGRMGNMVSSVLGHVPGSALATGTAILAGFMVSARLPKIKTWLKEKAFIRFQKYAPALSRVRNALTGWLKAQLKLSGMSFLIVAAGLFLLRVPYAVLWALLTALVDAIPVLGTGTVLLPWALVCLLQGETVRAIGLLAVYAVAFLARTALEPRLVGKQLGLDPLMTLIALYAGYRLWGIGGMLLAPLLSVAAKELSSLKAEKR